MKWSLYDAPFNGDESYFSEVLSSFLLFLISFVPFISYWPELGNLHTYNRKAGKVSVSQWYTPLEP